MAYAEEKHSLRQVSSIAGVVLVHAAIGYAFISGLAYQVYTELPTILQVINIPEDTPPPEPRAEARTERVSVPDKVVTVVGQPGDGIVAPPPPLPTTAAHGQRTARQRRARTVDHDRGLSILFGQEQ